MAGDTENTEPTKYKDLNSLDKAINDAQAKFEGNISDVRVTNGTALYRVTSYRERSFFARVVKFIPSFVKNLVTLILGRDSGNTLEFWAQHRGNAEWIHTTMTHSGGLFRYSGYNVSLFTDGKHTIGVDVGNACDSFKHNVKTNWQNSRFVKPDNAWNFDEECDETD